ncbi:hypothetical protein NBRC116594_02980 [Shimia sp. NS0008-38b]|uniref:6-hydroxynicotinate reductase n=1 Tax=Shimia sp. NS0008-38b TaxID=3127653 RepID=UPI00310421F6
MSPQARNKEEKIRCDACPVMCYIGDGKIGACDRYANLNGEIVRCDPLTVLDRAIQGGTAVRPFLGRDWHDGLNTDDLFVTAVGAGTTYPDYKPAPFLVQQSVQGADFVTVVTEAIFSYCGVKVKIDTDRHLGEEGAQICHNGEAVGLMITSEYGSQMMSLGGVDHLTGGSKAEGRVTCDVLLRLLNREAVDLSVEGGAEVVVQAGEAPIVNGVKEVRMRVGCGSATIGMFSSQWKGLADEVVVVDDHITGVVSEHQAGKVLGWPDTGIRIKGRRSTPGRYFQVAAPGPGWGGTDISDPLDILGPWRPEKGARAGLTMLMVSTTGEHAAFYRLDAELQPQPEPIPDPLRASVALIAQNCEPALCTVMFMGGAGGSLRSGVTQNPVKLTQAVQSGRARVSVGGADSYVWPGGGITLMTDVTKTPRGAFGMVPTPAIVAPLEFTIAKDDYAALGGHTDEVRPVLDILQSGGIYARDSHVVSDEDQQE